MKLGSHPDRLRFHYSAGQWVWITAIMLAVLFMCWAWFATEPAPPRDQWPSYYPWEPGTGDLVFPTSGEDAKQMFVLKGWLDAKMPFVPALAFPYISAIFIWVLVVPFVQLIPSSFRRWMTLGISLVASQALLLLGVWLYHTKVIRDVNPDGYLFGDFVKSIYAGDPLAMNGWPSGHCTWTMVCLCALWRLRRVFPKTAWILMAWLSLVFPATVMLRQHYLIDVYTGILLGFATYWACMFLIERPRLVPRDEREFPPVRATDSERFTVMEGSSHRSSQAPTDGAPGGQHPGTTGAESPRADG